MFGAGSYCGRQRPLNRVCCYLVSSYLTERGCFRPTRRSAGALWICAASTSREAGATALRCSKSQQAVSLPTSPATSWAGTTTRCAYARARALSRRLRFLGSRAARCTCAWRCACPGALKASRPYALGATGLRCRRTLQTTHDAGAWLCALALGHQGLLQCLLVPGRMCACLPATRPAY